MFFLKKKPKKLLIMALSEVGKTALAEKSAHLNHAVRINADVDRKKALMIGASLWKEG